MDDISENVNAQSFCIEGEAMETAIVVKENKVGRPCKYETDVQPRLNEIEKWIKEGLTDYCIADNLGIHIATLCEYKKIYNELSETYTRARKRQVQKVVNAVFQRAKGYDYIETTTEGKKVTKKVTKHIPGDVNAQKFYLINRDPEHWQPETKPQDIGVEIKITLDDKLSKFIEKPEPIEVTDFQEIKE
jgi:deoxyxylulose-5-phosphate synthase